MKESTATDRLGRLQRSLVHWLDDASVQIETYRDGVDCWVDLVHRANQPSAVVRSAKVELRETRYEGLVDFGAALEREVLSSRLLREADVPTPAVLAWHRTADLAFEPSWMLVEFVPHTTSEEVPVDCHFQLGQLARKIHEIKPTGSDFQPLAPNARWSEWVHKRILQRVEAAGRYMPTPARTDLGRGLQRIIRDRDLCAVSLLHLDLRGPNLIFHGNRLLSIFDMGNAIVGDPFLELARLRGCGLLTPQFIQGYNGDETMIESATRILDAYELDLTALLVVVSREEFEDERLHTLMRERTTELFSKLLR